MKRKKKINNREQVTWTKMITVRIVDTIKAKKKKEFLTRHGGLINAQSLSLQTTSGLDSPLLWFFVGCSLAQHP